MHAKVFISYSTFDLAVATHAKRELEAAGHNAYMAEYDARGGVQLTDDIKKNIAASDVFVVFWSSNAKNSNWVTQEVGIAESQKKIIVPIVLEPNFKPTGFISDRKYVSASGDLEKAFVELKIIVGDEMKRKEGARRNNADAFTALSSIHELTPVVDFVSREGYAHPVVAALEKESPHETLIAGYWGMPGAGKTQLVNHVAARLYKTYSDIQLRRDFRGYDEKPGLTIAEGLRECLNSLGLLAGVETDDIQTLKRIYASALVGRKALIVLDDIADGEAIKALSPPPGCALLFTSRDRLDVGGLHVELKPPLLEEARSMFNQIVKNIDQSIATDICELCENLPLAVCAAAGFIATTPDCNPEQYRDELLSTDDPLDYLGKVGVPRSVAVSFTLSYRRLSKDQQRVLRELAVFTGDFSADAEVFICSDPKHEILSFLVRRALVFFNRDAGRYRVHSLMQVFARRQLGTESEVIQLNHARYYLSRLKEIGASATGKSETIRRAQDELARDWAQIAAAQKACANDESSVSNDSRKSLGFEFAAAAPELVDLYLLATDRIQWLEAGLRWRSGNAQIQASILIRLANAYQALGTQVKALECLRAARSAATKAKSEELEIRAAAGIARINVRDRQSYTLQWKSHIDELKGFSEKARDRYPELRVEILQWLAGAYVQHVDRTGDDAINWAKSTLRAAARLQPAQPHAIARAMLTLGRAYIGRKRFTYAAGWLRRGKAGGEECGNRKLVSEGYGNLAKLAEAKHDWAAAAELANKSLDINRRFCGNRPAEAAALVLIATALAEQGEWIASGENCIAGVTLALQLNQRHVVGKALKLLAENPSVPDQLQNRLQHAGDQLMQRKLIRFDGREILKEVQAVLKKESVKRGAIQEKGAAGFLAAGLPIDERPALATLPTIPLAIPSIQPLPHLKVGENSGRAHLKLQEWAGGDRVTLAIVFTDAVGATALGNKIGDEAMNKVWRAHFAKSRELISKYKGWEIKTVGDRFVVVFKSTGEALDYAVALHLDTGHELVRIRAGLHIGPMDIEREDVLGSTVSFAVRVIEAIQGSEIWLSGHAKEDIDRLRAGSHQQFAWQAHENQQMKGFEGSFKLWSLKLPASPARMLS
jgi:class 3 adenylate cyclase